MISYKASLNRRLKVRKIIIILSTSWTNNQDTQFSQQEIISTHDCELWLDPEIIINIVYDTFSYIQDCIATSKITKFNKLLCYKSHLSNFVVFLIFDCLLGQKSMWDWYVTYKRHVITHTTAYTCMFIWM